MDDTRILWGAVAIAGMFCPIIGMVVGLFRYRKNKDKVIKEEREKREKAQEKGGIPSLFFKQYYKRVFFKTFGIPIYIGLLIGLVLMLLAFRMM